MTSLSNTTTNNEITAFGRILQLLKAIERTEKPGVVDLSTATGIPVRTIHSLISRLKCEYRVIIHRVNGRRYGHYEVYDWGFLDRDSVLLSNSSQV